MFKQVVGCYLWPLAALPSLGFSSALAFSVVLVSSFEEALVSLSFDELLPVQKRKRRQRFITKAAALKHPIKTDLVFESAAKLLNCVNWYFHK